MIQLQSTAQPRINLLGNPSDIYGGTGIGFPIWNWQAKVYLNEKSSSVKEIPILKFTKEVFSKHFNVQNKFSLNFISNIPKQSGLAGSSAIIIAALRVMGQAYGFEWKWKSLKVLISDSL